MFLFGKIDIVLVLNKLFKIIFAKFPKKVNIKSGMWNYAHCYMVFSFIHKNKKTRNL